MKIRNVAIINLLLSATKDFEIPTKGIMNENRNVAIINLLLSATKDFVIATGGII